MAALFPLLTTGAVILLLTAATPAEAATVQSQSSVPADSDAGYCCLPVKWHSRLTKINEKLFTFIQSGAAEKTTAKPIPLEVFVNHRRPKFELRGGEGSVVFWRGHMWLFQAGGRWPRLLNPVPHGFKPSGGFAPLFFRCLADKNGFQRLNATHYRMAEPDVSPAGRRLGLATVTDVRVVPATAPAAVANRRGPAPTCLLTGFSVTARYAKFVPGKGLAIVNDFDDYRLEAPAAWGWPDQTLTERTRAYRGHYRALLRSGGVRLNRPHLGVPVAAFSVAKLTTIRKYRD